MRFKNRLMNLESITKSANHEPNFFFIEDPSQEENPHYTACSELPEWTILADEGESIISFQDRVKQEYKREMKAKKIKLPRYVVFFGMNPK